MGGPFVLEALAQEWVSAGMYILYFPNRISYLMYDTLGVTAHPVALSEDHFRNAKSM